MLNLNQDTRVEFNLDGLRGTGKVVGIATNGQPVIGRSIIIEPDQPIISEVYKFSHFTVFEAYLKII